MERYLNVLSCIAIVASYVLFVRGIRRDGLQPNKLTWAIWVAQDILLWTSKAKVDGFVWGLVMPSIWIMGSSIVLAMSFTHGKRAHTEKTGLSRLESICLLLSVLGIGVGILFWSATGQPWGGLIAAVATICVGGIPTFARVLAKPESEPLWAWVLMLGGTVLNALAAQQFSVKGEFMPITIGISQALIILPLVLHALKKNRAARA